MASKHLFSLYSFFICIFLFLSTSNLQAHPDSFAPIVKSEKEKIVHIAISSIVKRSSRSGDRLFDRFNQRIPRQQRQSALGSGFLVSHDGYIVTNHHVIAKADKIEVMLHNGKKYKAKIIGKDKQTELALIKIEAKNLPFVEWGNSAVIEVGDWVLAIGNPLGLDHTVTAGIISAKGRNVFGNTAYGQFLQTDAAINFGNSGGPLFNMDAEVIGINTAIVAGGQNLGFSIPSNLARKVIDQLKKHGKVERGWFGVTIQDVNRELAESFGLPDGMLGIVLTSILPDSPAEKAGLIKGDILVEFNGISLKKVTQLQQFVAETSPGTEVRVKLFRKGNFLNKTIKVTLSQPTEDTSLQSPDNFYKMRLVEMTMESRSSMNVKENYGLLVYDIDPSGVAWEKGIRKNDVILEANNQQLLTLADFTALLEKAQKQSRPISLLILRNGSSIYMALPVKN